MPVKNITLNNKVKHLESQISTLRFNMSNSSNPLGVKLERFSGSETENPKEWLKKFETYTEFQGWKDEKKYAAFKLMLDGVAELWFKSLDEESKADFATASALLRTRFERKTPTWVEVEGLFSQKQGPGESVDDYIKKLRIISAELNLQPETYMTIFIRGLQSQIQETVANHNPKTPEEAEEWAKVSEKISVGKFGNLDPRPEGTLLGSQSANAHYVNGVVVEQAAQIDRLAKTVERMESRFDKIMNLLIENKSASSSDDFKRTEIGKPFCRICNVAGHTDQGCRARQIRTCHFCKEPGHFRRNCPKLARSNVNYFCPPDTLPNQSFNSVPCYPTGSVYAQSQMNQQNSQPHLGQQNPIYGVHQSVPGTLNSQGPFRQGK